MTDKPELTNKVKVTNSPSVTMNLYEINKQLYAQVPKDTDIILRTAFSSIGSWFSVWYKDKYFILMNREKMDITIFHFNDSNYEYAKEQVRELLESRGEVIHIEYDHQNDAYDCWIKNNEGDAFLYKLFNAQFMVVEV